MSYENDIEKIKVFSDDKKQREFVEEIKNYVERELDYLADDLVSKTMSICNYDLDDIIEESDKDSINDFTGEELATEVFEVVESI